MSVFNPSLAGGIDRPIRCLVGDVGNGKSLFCVGEIMLALQDGREVYCNFPLTDKFKEDYPELAKHYHVMYDFVEFLLDRERQAYRKPFREFQDLLVIDEAANVWDARTALDKLQRFLVKYARISRKLGLELLMNTPLARMLDVQPKRLVKIWIECTKVVAPDGEFWFKYRRGTPEGGWLDEHPTWFSPAIAAQYYPYYESTRLPFLPLGGDEGEGMGSKPLSATQFAKFKHETVNSLRGLNKSVKRIEKALNVGTSKHSEKKKVPARAIPRKNG